MTTDAQRETTGVLLRLARPMLDALDRMEVTTGTDRTNYIRQAIWQALVRDGFVVPPQEGDRSRDVIDK
ncbi:MAG: hypothetical protein DYG90_00510 [Chloroflexi bacterium CFX6]|nr:hypothetical protein [Chloroflexi bacterium CFX6]